MNFLKFEADRIENCLEFIKGLQSKKVGLGGAGSGKPVVVATGGGAFKYYDKMRETLQVEVFREDEMECLIIGIRRTQRHGRAAPDWI